MWNGAFMTSLHGKSVVVTGAGRGIGAAYARAAADEGARVVVNDIDGDVAEQVAADIRDRGGTALAKVADLRRWAEAADLIEFCVSEFGTIDGLVNNAGLFDMAMPGEVTESQLNELLAVNVAGVVACSMPAIRHMRRRGGGSIVNVTSGAHMGIAHMAAYAATKGAVASLTYTWSLELAASGVRVNAISPLARTRMADTTAAFLATNGLGRIHTEATPAPEANAPVAVFLLSDASAHITGQIVRIEGSDLALVAHPAILDPVLSADGLWTPDGVARAFEESLGRHLVPVGMGPLLRAEYVSGASAFWDGTPTTAQ
jgi:NAD(P)-dependent dehydrogenase (short-subunit alcohol dehydrogenase family)